MAKMSLASLVGFLSTPSARRATFGGYHLNKKKKFLSTPSARRATQMFQKFSACKEISIHALREEGDKTQKARYRA